MKKQFINKLAGELKKAKAIFITKQEEDSNHCWVSTPCFALKLDNSAYQQLVFKFNSYNIVHNLPLEVGLDKTYCITKGREAIEINEGFKLESLLSAKPTQEASLTNFKYYAHAMKQEVSIMKTPEGLITVNTVYHDLCFRENPLCFYSKQGSNRVVYGFGNDASIISLMAPIVHTEIEVLEALTDLLKAN